MLVWVGIALWALAAGWLLALYFTRPHAARFPHYGYLGLAVIAVAEVLLFRGKHPIPTFFTPIAWTGYIAVVDAMVFSLRGESLLQGRGRQFLAAAAFSAPFWLIFEAYNLRLLNWAYIGVPPDLTTRYLGYAWAFTTIWPAMLETAMLLAAAGLWRRTYPPLRFSAAGRRWLSVLGAGMLLVPLLAPRNLAAYLFGCVWLGFVFLLDPVNSRLGEPSLLDDLEAGRRGRLYSLLAAGAVCGIFWEFWNYWASGKWLYIFPILQSLKIFEMPAPGYFGFPPFAAEYFCAYIFLLAMLKRMGVIRRLDYVPDI